MNVIEGNFTTEAVQGRYAIVVSRFNAFVVESLLQGALDALKRHGVAEDTIDVVRVPGAWELPLVVDRVARKDQYDAVIALGAVIRGGTPHFEYVSGECTKGISQASIEHDVPVAFGVLTVDTIEQAVERSGTKAGNKGAEAAMSAMEMVSLLKQLHD